MNTKLKLSSVAIACAVILSACGGGTAVSVPNTPTPTPSPSPVSVGISSPGTLFGAEGVNSNAQSAKVGVKALPAGSGVVYYLPIVNTGSSAFSITSAVASNNSSNVWATDITNCSSVPAGQSCNLEVGFNADNLTDASQLDSLITVTYSNGTISSLPVSGTVVETGSLNVQMPSTIVPDSNGNAYGVITLFNGTSNAQIVNASTIAPTSQQGVTWTFTPNCDGLGGGTVASSKACSIAYVYHVDTSVAPATPEPISVSVPVVNADTGVTKTVEPVASVTPPSSTSNPLPYVVYSGASVSVATGSGSFVLQNVGNAALSGIQVTGLSPLTQTNTCTNVAPNATCTVTLSGSNPPSSITVIPSSGNSGNIIVPVVGQALAVSPAVFNFGDNFSGAVRTTSFTISNLGATTLSSLNTVLANVVGSAFSASSNSCSSTLNKFASCNVTVSYTAPTAAGAQSGTLTASATGQVSQTANFSAVSQTSNWSSVFTGRSGYTDSGAAILSLSADGSNNLYFGNSMAPNVSGARNVWELSGNTLTNLTSSSSTYTYSAPTALSVYSSGQYFVGHYDGSVQNCNGSTCATTLASSGSTLGVTSLVKATEGLYIGLSDKTTGVTGQLWLNAGSSTQVSGVTGAVGKMATDGTLTYVPIHTLNSTGTLLAANNGILGSTNLAPNTLASGEFITVVFFANNTLYAGTSMGNVYSSALPVSGTSWTKLTSLALSTQSFVGALGLDASNNLYAGLVNLSSPTSGGGVYVLQNGSFVASQGYTDTSSVSSMLLVNGMLNVATYNGNIWKIQ